MRAVNLIPAEQRESSGSLTGSSGGAALILIGLIAGLVVLAFVYGMARHNTSKAKTEVATANNELVALRAQIGQLAPYTSFISMAKQRVETTSQLVASRFDWSHAFNELGRVLPKDASLSTLQGKVGETTGTSTASTPAAGATPSSVTPPGSTPTFTISGCATSQSEVAQTLQRLRLMDGVSDVELQSSAKSSGSGASSGGAGAGSGSCPAHDPTFSATVTFTGLPTPPATNAPAAATTTVANTTGASR